MKIIVRSPLKADSISALLDGLDSDGIRLRFLSKSGINLAFEAEGADSDTVIALVKSTIKGTDFGKVLNFSVISQ